MAISIASLLVSICQNLTNSDVTKMPDGEKFRVYGALNRALEDWFTQASPTYTVNEASTQIFAPVVLQIAVTQNSTQFTVASGLPAAGTTYTNLASIVNQAIIIDGDGQSLNRIQSVSGATGTLWRAYLGTTGNVSATVYSDAITFQQTDFRIVQPPAYTGASGYPLAWPLEEWNQVNPWMFQFLPEGQWLGSGRPLYYITGSHIPLNGTAAPYWYMRLWPLPGYTGNISYTIKSMPPVYKDSDRASQRLVPIPDQYRNLIAHLCQRDLMASSLWNTKCNMKAVMTNIEDSERKLFTNIAAHSTNSSPRQVGTPRNF